MPACRPGTSSRGIVLDCLCSDEPRGKGDIMRALLLVLIAAIACGMVLFGVQNTQPVSVRFLWLESGLGSLSLVMVLAAVAGALLVALFWLWDQVRFGLRSRRMGRQVHSLEGRSVDLQRRLAELEAENSALREQMAALTGTLVADTPPAAGATQPDGNASPAPPR
jgi:uncharacterized integral membrane protein